jgi:hypothetical protein
MIPYLPVNAILVHVACNGDTEDFENLDNLFDVVRLG